MKFKIIAEAHEGVYSVDEECLAVVNASTVHEAMGIYAIKDPRLTWVEDGFWINARRIVAVPE